ncbi:MAG: cadmium transporter [Acidimicrobiaceae bacterium]|nr:cadmium transporter [Acidimicrobiaceae bacterium]
MRTIVGVVLVASLAFLGTMVDNFFAFSAQLVLTEPTRYRRVSWAQAGALSVLVVIAGSVGTLLDVIPVRWIGLLCVAPFGFALHAWRHRESPHEQFRRGAITTFLITLALGGDNVAVWIPLFRAAGVRHGLVALGTFVIGDILFLLAARKLATHPKVVEWGRARMPSLMPYVYALLGVLILIECHTI